MTDLTQQHCRGEARPVDAAMAQALLAQLPGWQIQGQALTRQFKAKDHYQIMAFVNAVVWISHTQDHHPELVVGYNTCTVSYTTHSTGGLSHFDFICAARVSLLHGPSE